MKHYEPKHIAVLSDRGFYTILTVCGLIIAASAWVLWMNAGRGEQPVAVEPAAPVVTPAEEVPDLTVQDIPVTAEEPESGEETPAEAESLFPCQSRHRRSRFPRRCIPADRRGGADAVFGRYAAVSADARRLARAQRNRLRVRGRRERAGADRRHGADRV